MTILFDEAGAPMQQKTAESGLPDSAVAYLSSFYAWALTLPLEDVQQILPILQTIRTAHVLRQTDSKLIHS